MTNMGNGGTGYLTAEQVAGRVGVCRETVKRWARDGRLPGIKNLSGHWLFEPADIDAIPIAEHDAA